MENCLYFVFVPNDKTIYYLFPATNWSYRHKFDFDYMFQEINIFDKFYDLFISKFKERLVSFGFILRCPQFLSGSDLLRLRREDLIQICGIANGIRLHNTLLAK